MKKIGSLLLTIILILTLAGCNAIPDVTPEQHAQIVEYSAGLLLKYDRFYENNLVAIAIPTPKPEPTPTPEPEEDEDEPSLVMGGTPEIIDNSLPRDLTEVIGISGLEFHYAGSLVTNQYPHAVVPGEIYFYVTASPGNNLLVIRFNVVNTTSSDIHLDMTEYNLRLRIGYDGANVSSTLFTMLENDFAMYRGVIAAGETMELASICEVSVNDIADIQSIEFYIRSNSGDFTYYY